MNEEVMWLMNDTGRYRAALAAKKKREPFQVSLGCVPVVCVSVFVSVCLCICLSLYVHKTVYLCAPPIALVRRNP